MRYLLFICLFLVLVSAVEAAWIISISGKEHACYQTAYDKSLGEMALFNAKADGYAPTKDDLKKSTINIPGYCR